MAREKKIYNSDAIIPKRREKKDRQAETNLRRPSKTGNRNSLWKSGSRQTGVEKIKGGLCFKETGQRKMQIYEYK